MMAAAAGIATTGLIPIVTTFAVFATMGRWNAADLRRVPQAQREGGRQPLRPRRRSAAGAVRGSRHHPIRSEPTVVSPGDPIEMRLAVRAILDHDGPVYLRTGRSPVPTVFPENHRFTIGRAQVLEDGDAVSIVASGVMVHRALAAAAMLRREGLRARVVSCPTLKPLDVDLLVASAERTGAVVTAEDHNVIGRLGGAVAGRSASAAPCPSCVSACAIASAGSPEALAEHYKIDADIAAAACQLIRAKEARECA